MKHSPVTISPQLRKEIKMPLLTLTSITEKLTYTKMKVGEP